jgi:hypothetical protein
LVKFQVRWIKKDYGRKRAYRYKHYSLSFPVRLNEEIDPHQKKDFEVVDFTLKETDKQELINITLARDKTTNIPKPD